MSTLVLNLNDTIFVRDSVLVNAVKVIETPQPKVVKMETNVYDLGIAIAICLAIAFVSIYALYTFRCKEKKAKPSEITNNEDSKQKDADRRKAELDAELERYKAKRSFDIEKEKELELQKTNNQQIKEMLESVCSAAKDKEGHINKDVLEQLLIFYKENKV